MEPIIRIENLSKLYRLGTIGTGTLSNDLKRWWYLSRGKEDPFQQVGVSNNRSMKSDSDYVWALKDINFEVNKGEILGIIGKNGAGKSTLLKILSKVTGPTTGKIEFNGRIGSLLEVGTGFHPELTGRENIFLNGAILGMTRHEIRSKLDEIVDFSGCERYIDTPVKRYSSGMTVRLGFAVAAHLEPEILIVDEVLAVGDAEFQKKAIGKMKDVSHSDGRTVLFVSHNMAAVKNLCDRGIVLKDGTTCFNGQIEECVEYYLSENLRQIDGVQDIEEMKNRKGTGKVILSDFWVENLQGKRIENILSGDDVKLAFKVKSTIPHLKKVVLGFSFRNTQGANIGNIHSSFQNVFFELAEPGYHVVRFTFRDLNLAPGRFLIDAALFVNGELSDWVTDSIAYIDVQMGDYYQTGSKGDESWGDILFKGEWSLDSVNAIAQKQDN